VTVSVDGRTCGEFGSPLGQYDASMQLDQFGFTSTDPQPLDTFAAQISCSDADVSITGTIAFNAQNTTPTTVLPL